MITLAPFLLLALALDAPAPPAPQAGPPVVAPAPVDPTPDALTWEEVPEPLRLLADGMIGKPAFQSVVRVDAAAPADAAPRTVAYGGEVFSQTVRPAAAVRVKSAPDGKPAKYGPAGALFWAARGADGDFWCWRDQTRAANVYCLQDKNGDGRAEKLFENTLDKWVGANSFQVGHLGHDEGLAAPVAYEPASEVPPYEETIAIRYIGPVAGRVTDDGRIVDGRAGFEVVTRTAAPPLKLKPGLLVAAVTQPSGERRLRRFAVDLDENGRGEHRDLAGFTVAVDRVAVEGDAELRVVSGLPVGERLLDPPLTREKILEELSELLGPDGRPKPRP